MKRLLLLACLALLPPAQAADDGKAGKRLQAMLRKAEQEKSLLAREKAALETQLREMQAKLDAAGGKITALGASAASRQRALDGCTEEKALAVKNGEQLTAQLAETRQAAADEKLRLEAIAAKQQESIASCRQANLKLHQHGGELLDAYQSKSCADALRQAEPFTRLKRVEIENLVEDYRDKLDAQKLFARPEDPISAS